MIALEAIEGALKLLGVKPAESAITAVEAEDGLKSLNDMLNEWEGDEIRIGFESVDDVQDELYVDKSLDGPIKANLAVYIAPEYSRPVSAELALRAERGLTRIRASIPIKGSDYPDSLPVGSGNESIYSGDGDAPGSRGGRFYPSNDPRKCS